MGCCGQRYPVNNIPSEDGSFAMTALVGSDGMTAVEYVGGNFGTATYYGPITGTAYRFDAGANKKKMVDNRDLSTSDQKGLLDLREHTKTLFVISQDQPVAPSSVVTVLDEEEVIPSGGTDISTIVTSTSVSYKKLTESGITTTEQLSGETVESLMEKTGISKTAAKALLEAI